MRKKTAKIYGAVLICMYLFLISGGVIWWFVSHKKDTSSQTTLSGAVSSDNVASGENGEGEKQEFAKEDETVDPEKDSDHTNGSDEVQKEDNSVKDEIENTDAFDTVNQNQEEESDSSSVNMVFTGDVYIGNYVSTVYDTAGIGGVVSDSLIKQFVDADIAMVNQEFPFSTRGTPMEDKQYTFRVNPLKVNLLKELGIDIVSLANNHTLDYGVDALTDTLTTLTDAGITYVGAGNDLTEAKTTRYYEIDGQTIAFLSASRVIPVAEWAATKWKPGLFTTYDPTTLLEEIKIAKSKADTVVVYLHWGLEHKEYPERYERVMGKKFIDAGADLVLGSHPHVLQGFEYYNGKVIAYSLGNFIFSQNINQTAMLSIDVTKDNAISVKVIPCYTVNGQTREITDETKRQEVLNYLSSISTNAIVDSDGNLIEP